MQAPLLPRRLPRLPRRLGLGAALGLVTALGGCATTSPDTSHDWSELGRRDGFARYGDPRVARAPSPKSSARAREMVIGDAPSAGARPPGDDGGGDDGGESSREPDDVPIFVDDE
ncbi:MAG: hypothetical protein KC468_24745 [Myxococcales bacterium]|nr:hypothetical protein [Myxococcales bacterium]